MHHWGRWYLNLEGHPTLCFQFGDHPRDSDYYISLDRIGEEDWVSHIAEKRWGASYSAMNVPAGVPRFDREPITMSLAEFFGDEPEADEPDEPDPEQEVIAADLARALADLKAWVIWMKELVRGLPRELLRAPPRDEKTWGGTPIVPVDMSIRRK